MSIGCENDWLFYKELVRGSQVGCADIVVDVCNRSMMSLLKMVMITPLNM